MRRFTMTATFCVAIGLSAGMARTEAQTFPKSLQESGPEDIIRQRQNQWTVYIAGGTMDTTWLRFAEELATVLDDGDEMRLIPMVSRGAAANVLDLLYLRGVDMAFTQSDVLEYFRTQRKIPNLENRIQYVIRLPAAELHVAARAGIRTVEDLRGRKVVFGSPGAASSLTGPIIFQRLGIEVEPLFIDHMAGLRMVIDGEAAALVGSAQKPVDFWLKVPSRAGLHLVPVPFTSALADIYVVGEFTGEDYPNLVQPGERIDTIAVPSLLAVPNAPKNTDRYRRLERFVQYMFNRWDKLALPQFHPRWRDVNLAATVPGWTRFAASDDMLHRPVANTPDQPPTFEEFRTYLNQEVHTTPRNDAERDFLFRQFMIWREHKP
jgi:TRAP-type uncharacterized transport system substrate-binding protein